VGVSHGRNIGLPPGSGRQGGFARLFAARRLARAPVQVTLIDRAEHHLFQPLLYQCSTGILSEGTIATPLGVLLRKNENVEFVPAEVTGIDAAGRTVTARRPRGEEIEFGYDYLVLAAGVRQSYFGHDEFIAVVPGMKSIGDALKIRRRVFGAFELAESATDPAERKRWLTFALVGAGPTGVALEGGSAPLATFGPKLSALAERELQKLGVELHMGCLVTLVDLQSVQVKDHDSNVTRHEVGNILWTAGVEARSLAIHKVVKATGAEQDRAGRLLCGKDFSLPGHPDILVTGDMMCLEKLSGVAETAMQTGLYAARRITQKTQGHAYDKPFRYHDLGSAAYISHLVRAPGRLRVRAAFRRLLGLGVAVHPHRLPHRHPQPPRRDLELVARLLPRHPPSATSAANAPSPSTRQCRPARTPTRASRTIQPIPPREAHADVK
jgi:NADH:ubiquinone reductase (H+-translocating)